MVQLEAMFNELLHNGYGDYTCSVILLLILQQFIATNFCVAIRMILASF
jgi:hypothetical protein